MRQVVFRAVLNHKKPRHAHIVKRRVVRSEGPPHGRLTQVQFLQRGQHLIHDLAVLIIIVQAQREDTACAGIVNQHPRDLLQFILVGVHVLHGADQPLLFSGE